ncbi:hypothetical protein [Desulfallas thermosapovorans]|uniref:DUF4440 domain-containing protein n=1 Tax=Desulfallas thermosapovorans DSM 6562 TaxID=1121431 RepID=A0A5S4ZXN8_9FIRM|nr:hypothetical protein [Desulfallas thermosapovorans]TYO97782.1 hypothetical protein LX24_00065 [Desulfallas thermosapovorans DSM 6562]
MFVKYLITFAVCLLFSLNCAGAQYAVDPRATVIDNEEHNIMRLIKQAMEYNWWSSESNYQVELSRFYTDPALDNILDSVKKYRVTSTDWYSLTFLENCHIVYKNGNTAVASAYLKDIDVITKNVQKGRGVFTLQKSQDGFWRIKDMDFYWCPDNNPLLDQEVTNY